MGNLLGTPVTEKETHSGSSEDGHGMEFAVSSMQGWRVHMEDAHILEPKIYAKASSGGGSTNGNENNDKMATGEEEEEKNATSKEEEEVINLPGHAVFAVFDGHGGTFAANYAGKNFCRVLSCQPKFVEYAKFATTKSQELEDSNKTPADLSAYLRSGLTLLEQALQDAFVEIDKEIGLAVKGSKHPKANTPYHPVVSATAQPPPSSNNNDNEDGDKMDTTTTATEESTSTDGTDPIAVAAQEAAREQVQALDDDGDSGTTACVVIVTPDWIVCANAGDSRAVFSKQGHRAVPLSYDHKPDDEGEERRIRAADGYVSGGRVEGDLAVSRGLGDFRFKSMATVLAGAHWTDSDYDDGEGKSGSSAQQSGAVNGEDKATNLPRPTMAPGDQKVSPIPDIIVQTRNPDHDEFVILACDGIWDVTNNQNCVDMIAEMFNEGESNAGLVCEELLDICLREGSKDNMTALLVKFKEQKVGEGGGVMARRQERENQNKDEMEGGETTTTTTAEDNEETAKQQE